MNTLQTILTRRSCRKFKDTAVEQEKIEQILLAAQNAPTGGNSQSTHFYVIQNREILTKLAEVVQNGFAKMSYDENTYKSIVNSINASKSGNYVFHYNAPLFVIVANKPNYANAMADCACALENMMLQANELDLGAVWINQLHWLEKDDSVRDFLAELGVDREEVICGSISIGYPDSESGLPNRVPKIITGNTITYIK